MAKPKKTNVKTSARPAPLAHNPFAALAPKVNVPAVIEHSTKAVNERASKKAAKTRSKTIAGAPKTKQKEVTLSADAKNWGRKLVLSREKKGRGGKTVTRITGLPKAHVETVAKNMKKALGCGASVDGDDVLLHGMLTDRGAAWLIAQGAGRVIIGN